MMKLIAVILILSIIGVATYATSATVTQTVLQSNSGVLQHIYYQTSSGPGSTTPSTNTALTPSGSSSSYTIAAGASGYLWSPSFSTATTLPSGKMMFDVWASVSSASAGLDGSASAINSGGTISIALTTTRTNDVLYVSVVVGQGITVSSVASSPSLTWTRRLSVAFSTSNNRHLDAWYAIWSGSGANTITVTLSASANAAAVAFGISGANTVSPFDSNAAIPSSATGTSTSASVTISTSNPNDFLIGTLGTASNPTLTTGTGFTLVLTQSVVGGTGNTHTDSAEYQSVTTTQSNLAVGYSWSGAQDWAIIGDAIVSAQPVTVTLRTTDSAGTLVSTLLAASNTNPLLTTKTQVATIYSISSGSIPVGGYLELIITAPASVSITVYWGSGQQTNFQVPKAIAS
jgi:hypothetical protein